MKAVFGKSEKKFKISSDLLNSDTCVYSKLTYIKELVEKSNKVPGMHIWPSTVVESHAGFAVRKKQTWIFHNTSRGFPYKNEFSWLQSICNE